MSTRHLQRFFAPESVVVVGASERPDSFGGYVLRNLRAAGYAGQTFAVHPDGGTTVHGVPRFARLSALSCSPDLAVLCNPPEMLPSDIEALGKAGVKAALVLFGGRSQPASRVGGGLFQWTREFLGRPLQTLREVTLKAAEPYDLRIMGPNCMGIISPALRLNASFSPLNPPAGETAFVGQSGMLGLAFADWAERGHVGFSHLITLGDSLDVDLTDVIEYLAQDPKTKVIYLHIERFPSGRRFLSAVRAAARHKVLIALKSARAAQLQDPVVPVPAGLSNVDAVHDAVLRRAGVLRIDRTDELVGTMSSLSLIRGLAGERLAIISNGSGPELLGADALLRSDGILARLHADTTQRLRELLPSAWNGRNPIDIQADATPGRYRRALEVIARDPDVDAILVIVVPTALAPPLEVAGATIAVKAMVRQPVLTSWMGESTVHDARDNLRKAGVPTFGTPEQAVESFMQIVRHRRAKVALEQTPRLVPESQPSSIRAVWALVGEARLTNGKLGDEQSFRLLHAYGISGADRPPEPQPTSRGFDAPVLSFGITRDATFGPLILFGAAAHPWQAAAERAVALPPLNDTLARMLVESTPFGRDLSARATDAQCMLGWTCGALIRLSRLAIDVPVMCRLEMEAVMVRDGELQVLSARIDVGEAVEPAIVPYPEELRETMTVRGGRRIEMRPIRGEDEPKHLEFLSKLSPTTVRNRIFAARSSISHRDLAHLTQIDYAREMAFVAEGTSQGGEPEILGVVRAWTDPDNVSAEFAIVVRDDVSGLGLGSLLLEKLINYTRDRGTLQLQGRTLPGNTQMRHLAERAGFSSHPNPEEGVILLDMALNSPLNDWQRERLGNR